jgi:hypothetical protein
MPKESKANYTDNQKRHAAHFKNGIVGEWRGTSSAETRRRAQNRKTMWGEVSEVYDGE